MSLQASSIRLLKTSRDGLLLARRHTCRGYSDYFYYFVQDFCASRGSRAVAAPGSHGSGVAETVAPSDRLSANLEGTASSRSLELGVRVGTWYLNQVMENKQKCLKKSSRATSSSFQHLQHLQSFHGQSCGPSTSLHPNQILLCKGQLETHPQLQGCHISSWSLVLPMPQSQVSWGWEAAAKDPNIKSCHQQRRDQHQDATTTLSGHAMSHCVPALITQRRKMSWVLGNREKFI